MPNLSRAELYELVWSKPVTHIAKELGVSDVAIKKHCVKHAVPTPPVGYWARVAHGQNPGKPPLPTRNHSTNELVQLPQRTPVSASAESIAAKREAELRLERLKLQLVVPETLPDSPLNLTRAVRAALRRTKADSAGFLNLVTANSRTCASVAAHSIG